MRTIKIIILFILPFISWYASAKTITQEELIGSWKSAKPITWKEEITVLLHDLSKDQLEISKDLSIKLSRHLENGSGITLETGAEGISFHEDIAIIKFYKSSELSAKLVISGWSSGKNKRIFGHLYFYNAAEGLFNGMPISLEPASGS